MFYYRARESMFNVYTRRYVWVSIGGDIRFKSPPCTKADGGFTRRRRRLAGWNDKNDNNTCGFCRLPPSSRFPLSAASRPRADITSSLIQRRLMTKCRVSAGCMNIRSLLQVSKRAWLFFFFFSYYYYFIFLKAGKTTESDRSDTLMCARLIRGNCHEEEEAVREDEPTCGCQHGASRHPAHRQVQVQPC